MRWLKRLCARVAQVPKLKWRVLDDRDHTIGGGEEFIVIRPDRYKGNILTSMFPIIYTAPNCRQHVRRFEVELDQQRIVCQPLHIDLGPFDSINFSVREKFGETTVDNGGYLRPEMG